MDGKVQWLECSDKPVLVPILVASNDFERPIIGFNVIEEVALTHDNTADFTPNGHIVQTLCSVPEVGRKTARAVLAVLKRQKPESPPHIFRVGRQLVTIQKNKVLMHAMRISWWERVWYTTSSV